ncbi:MAG: amidohydrolase family protein [Ginsengibacter sp.]
MNYRKFRADYLFTGSALLDNNSVLITDEMGTILDIIPFDPFIEGVENYNGILSPGFINSHCHLELSHLDNKIPEKTGLPDFVVKVVTEREYAEEEILDAMNKAIATMARNGIVALGDICNTRLALPIKKHSALTFYNFIEVSGWNPLVANERLERIMGIYEDYLAQGEQAAIVPHAPYSVSSPLWEIITPFFVGKTITIHNQETPGENEFFLKGTGELNRMYQLMNLENSSFKSPGTTSLQSFFHRTKAAASLILVHNTFISQQDLDYIKEKKPPYQSVFFCLCPNANYYIENMLPPIPLLMKNDVQIVLGTDSLASNHQLDILEEIKTISLNFPSVETEALLTWATLNGAKALQLDERFGGFEPGKQPGVVLIENVEDRKITAQSTSRKIL